MYWFRPSKEYDPTPYSRFLRLWHKIFGCHAKYCLITYDAAGIPGMSCPCGVIWFTEGEEPPPCRHKIGGRMKL